MLISSCQPSYLVQKGFQALPVVAISHRASKPHKYPREGRTAGTGSLASTFGELCKSIYKCEISADIFDVDCCSRYILQAVNARPAGIDRTPYMDRDDHSKAIDVEHGVDWHQIRRFENRGILH